MSAGMVQYSEQSSHVTNEDRSGNNLLINYSKINMLFYLQVQNIKVVMKIKSMSYM